MIDIALMAGAALAILAIVGIVMIGLQPSAAGTPTQVPPVTAKTVDDTTVAQACRSAGIALRRGDPESAVKTLAAAGVDADTYTDVSDYDAVGGTCDSTWLLAARLAAEAPSNPQTVAEKTGGDWDSFIDSYAEPLAAAAGFVVAGWLALFVIARLLVEHASFRNRTSDVPSRARAFWFGWILLIASPVLGVVAAVATEQGLWNEPAAILAWGAVAVLAAIAAATVAAWLATIRTVKIDVTQAVPTTPQQYLDPASVSAQLRALAKSSKESIGLPAGPSADVLAKNLQDFSSIGWVAAFQKVVLFLVGVVPWNVVVMVSDAHTAAVTITRNRATQRIAVVSTEGTGLDALSFTTRPPGVFVDQQMFLATAVAAEILVTLRPVYRAELDFGLYGATVGRGVALQFIAIAYFTSHLNTNAAQALLAAALRADPYNQLARYSLAYVRSRHASDPSALVAFGQRLRRWIGDRAAMLEGIKADDELIRAMIFTYAAAARNLAAVTVHGTDPALRKQAVNAVGGAREWLEKYTPPIRADDDAEGLLLQRRYTLALHALTLAKKRLSQSPSQGAVAVPPPDKEETEARTGIETLRNDGLSTGDAGFAYNLTCVLVCWLGRPFDDDDVAQLLDVALVDPLLREFAAQDPELSAAQGYAAWLRTLPTTPSGPAGMYTGPQAPVRR